MLATISIPVAAAMVGNISSQISTPAPGPLPRMPLDEFVQSATLLSALRKGIREMKKRKQSDPLSWFYQAAIHGVTDDLIASAAKDDPNVTKVPPGRWNQCPHNGQNSANFLPWHRGYTYHFERILRMHTEDESFSLPYWDYSDLAKKNNRKFPREFGIEHLDGDQNNSAPENINPLHLPQRDFYLCTYEHPFVTNFSPLIDLSEYAVDVTIPMNALVFFGTTEQEGLGGGIYDNEPRTRGLLESYPHDQIHRAVGGIVIAGEVDPENGEFKSTAGFMAQPPTAGFDPIFPIHHSNIDRLWAKWSCLPGKQWGNLPPNSWFDESPWIFYDIDGKEVQRPRRTYFDHRALGVRFSDEDLTCTPLRLPSDISKAGGDFGPLSLVSKSSTVLSTTQINSIASTLQNTVIPINSTAKEKLKAPIASFKSKLLANEKMFSVSQTEKRLFIRLIGLNLDALYGTGFDVHLTGDPKSTFSRKSASFVGTISLFNHASSLSGKHHGMSDSSSDRDQDFDVTRAVSRISSEMLDSLSVVLVPYPLVSSASRTVMFIGANNLKLGGIEFFVK